MTDVAATVAPRLGPETRSAGAAGELMEKGRGVAQAIVGFHLDDEGHWVAELACGHNQHVRHKPPWQDRPWVVTAGGRAHALGMCLQCVECA